MEIWRLVSMQRVQWAGITAPYYKDSLGSEIFYPKAWEVMQMIILL